MENDLKTELIKITGIELVDKGKEPNTWKEYAIKVADYVKGTHYSVPLKKKDGEPTSAYTTLKKMKSEWEDKFIENEVVEVGVAVSVKEREWTHEGNSGTSVYKTIRFFKDATETRNELSKEEVAKGTPAKDRNSDPMPLEDIPF